MNFERGSTNIVRGLAEEWINNNLSEISNKIDCGLPEYDDRLKVWRVSIKPVQGVSTLGEIQVDKNMTKVVDFTDRNLVFDRFDKESKKRQILKINEKACSFLHRFPTK